MPDTTLEYINANYFIEIADRLEDDWKAEDERENILHQIILQYFLSMEAFFSLLLSLLFAPRYFYGWLVSYRNQDVHDLVDAISKKKGLPFRIEVDDVGWKSIASVLFKGVDRQFGNVSEDYGRLWEELAKRFNNQDQISAYNRIKHGFAVKPDAITKIQIGEPEKGVTLKSTGIGHRFGVPRRIEEDNKENLRIDSRFVHWNPQKCLTSIRMAGMSIHNLKERLKASLLSSSFKSDFYIIDTEELNDFLQAQEGIQAATMNMQRFIYDDPLPTKEDLTTFLSQFYSSGNNEDESP